MSSCAFLSQQAQEPLIGTSLAHIDRWVLVEQTGQWPSHPSLAELRVSDTMREMIKNALATPRTRLQWIRNSSTTTAPRVFLCAQERLYVSHEATTELVPEQMHLHTTPMILVCTHGSRDRCCGTLGGAIYAEAHKHAPEQVWQASHLGGHRFAPTLLVLPYGMMYGRIEESDIPALLTHPSAYAFSCDKLRGVPKWATEVQVAAHFLWQTKPCAIDSVHSTTQAENTWSVVLQCADSEQTFLVRKESMGISALASCGDTEEKEIFRYHCQYA